MVIQWHNGCWRCPLNYLTSLYGMKQAITEPTHILENCSSCIDLIFSNQPNLIMDSGVHPVIHSKGHHQVIYSKLNLEIEYPPPYTRKIWNYSRSETDLINNSIESFDWSKLFSGNFIPNMWWQRPFLDEWWDQQND